jgi:acetylglutamate kinase
MTAPIATGPAGETYNVNADHVAAAVAVALDAAMLVQLTDVPGVFDGEGHRLQSIGRAEVERLTRSGASHGGMLPKVDAGLQALAGGVARVRIVDGRRPHALGLALLARASVGTEIAL